MSLDDRACDREPEPGRSIGASCARSSLNERLEDALALVGRNAFAGVGDLDLDLSLALLGADDDASVRRRVPDRVLQQVEENALQLLRIGSRPGRAAGELGRDADDGGVGVRAHRLDRLVDDLGDRHALEAPADVARLEPGQLEEVVDQRAERVDVRGNSPEVFRPLLAVDDLITHRLGEEAEARDRRAQVMRDRGHQIAARALLGLDALQGSALDHATGPEPERGGECGRDHGEERVGSFDEHRRGHQRDYERVLRHDQGRHCRELAPQAGCARDLVGQDDRHRSDGSQDCEDEQPRVCAMAHERGQRADNCESHGIAETACHGAKR